VIPVWRNIVFDAGVLVEAVPDQSRIVLWLPRGCEKGFQYWERIGTVAGAVDTGEQGFWSAAASSIRARQRLRGFFGNLWQRFRKIAEPSWLLPNGASAEQCGERQTDLLLIWADGNSNLLNETWIKSRWPRSQRIENLGRNLFVVTGISQQGARNEAEPIQPEGNPREEAGQMLAAARSSGDRRREVSALTDLGIIVLKEGDAQGAFARLEEALVIVRELGDRSGEADVLGNLGLASVVLGQGGPAQKFFEKELRHAREAGDRFAEKIALEHIGLACSSLRDPARALDFFEQALALARTVGDRQHEAKLLWYQAIQHAELSQRDQAIAMAQTAVDLWEKMKMPKAIWFKDHLQKYRTGDPGVPAGTSGAAPALLSESFLTVSMASGIMPAPAGPVPEQARGGPGWLRMAFSATKSMATFFGSGFKTVSAETRQQRLRTCTACEHHTGLRCKICGCFTNLKSRMLHEECPIGKWSGE
jgi:tetratricopeptide (TPR) repeat protein